MKARYRMVSRAKRFLIEAENTEEGKRFLEKFRKENAVFKYQRISLIIQAFPNKVETRTVHTIN